MSNELNEVKPRRERGQGRIFRQKDSRFWWIQYYLSAIADAGSAKVPRKPTGKKRKST